MRISRLRIDSPTKNTCPTVNVTDRQTLIVQGDCLGGGVVEVPARLLLGFTYEEVTADGSPPTNTYYTGHTSDRRRVKVQGDPVTESEALDALQLPVHEAAVEVSIAQLLAQAEEVAS